jgi:hypothetical protein
MSGYRFIRCYRSGERVGALSANRIDTAGKRFLSVGSFAKSLESLYLDTPEPNRAAVALAERHGM